MTAEALPAELIARSGGSSVAGAGLDARGDLLGTADFVPQLKDEEFAFDRTISRLTEMQTTEYLVAGHQADSAAKSLEGSLLSRSDSGSHYILNRVSPEQLRQIWESYDADLDDTLSRTELQVPPRAEPYRGASRALPARALLLSLPLPRILPMVTAG